MLVVSGLSVAIDGVKVVRDVSLQVGPGRVVGLIGRNGAGKTTTLKAIMGLRPALGGEVMLGEQKLGGMAAEERARLGMGYVPEDRRLIGALSVWDNLMLPIWAMGLGKEGERRVEKVLETIPVMRIWRGRKAGTLSGGQQKVVALARGLVVGWRAVLLDEPLEGLSESLAQQMAQVVRRVAREEGIAVLMTESQSSRIERIVDEVYEMERGEIRGIRRW